MTIRDPNDCYPYCQVCRGKGVGSDDVLCVACLGTGMRGLSSSPPQTVYGSPTWRDFEKLQQRVDALELRQAAYMSEDEFKEKLKAWRPA